MHGATKAQPNTSPFTRRTLHHSATEIGSSEWFGINILKFCPSVTNFIEFQMDESIPPHVRYSNKNGYDDFHKSYQQISQQFPNTNFPVFGPPK
jgi:hypothetical protein